MTDAHLKICDDPAHRTAYSCARCNHVQCMACDRAVLEGRELRYGVKTAVRYCPHWRCQREKQIEEGALVVSPRKP